jgi:hypothetical protein
MQGISMVRQQFEDGGINPPLHAKKIHAQKPRFGQLKVTNMGT